MDSLGIAAMLKLASDFGLIGLVIFMWWADNSRLTKTIEGHRQDMLNILTKYGEDMAEQRKMYESNASLCKDFSSVASDLREIVIMNIQKMTHVDDAVRQNQFCPMLRVREEKSMDLVPRFEAARTEKKP